MYSTVMVARIEHQFIGDVEHKWCGRCKEFRQLDRFGYSKQTWDKFRPTCKDCLMQINKEIVEQRTEYNKVYWEKTKDEQREKCKKWREANKEHVKEKMKEWLDKNKEHKKKKDEEYRLANWDKKKEYSRMYSQKKYMKLKTDPSLKEKLLEHKIKSNSSRRLREILGQEKSSRCMDYVGCSLNKFRIILEAQWSDGMHWNNYGTSVTGSNKHAWHIDHTIPCSAFNMKNPIHHLACWSYHNLKPMWWRDNIIKQGSFDPVKRDNYLKWFIETKIIP